MYSKAIELSPLIKIWISAARPRTLTTAFIPILAATMLAMHETKVQWELSLFALLSLICIQIGTNLVNDALDFKKGADTESRIGPKRVTQGGLLSVRQVLLGGMVALSLGLLFGIPLMLHGGVPIILLLIASVICAYCYTGGPYPIAYIGLGELFVMLFYGFAAIPAVFYLQTGFISQSSILAGIQTGFLSALVLAMNNLRDRPEDAKANKKTLAVRFGATFALCEVTFLALAPFVLNLLWIGSDFTRVLIFPWLAFPLAVIIVVGVWRATPGPIYNRYFLMSALLNLLFGLLLSAGF
ncbi:MAG: 1,4-dihydroxy-2-naphthoate octaprenyltransferase [Parachlamydiaceae bacterium]|nr:1,4-dihydroxy-2-naphthoate octaprenyltransferase [Parachlamydiaceae bacterium]